MKLITNQFGEIEYTQEHVIKFTSGIFGFEQLKNYLFIKIDGELFYWLNSIESPEIAFPLIGVRIIDDKYHNEKDHEPFGIVTMNQDVLKTTVNLKAPVYINQTTRTGFQKILDTEKYPIKYFLFKE
jgi:flagellar assembly factor FliW